MTRITSTVLIMLLLLNGTASIMEVSGLNDDLGVSYTTGVSDRLNEVTDQLNATFSPNVNIIESFVSLALAGLTVFRAVIEGVLTAPALFKNLLGRGPVVNTVVDVVFVPMYVVATLELLFMATGRDTV